MSLTGVLCKDIQDEAVSYLTGLSNYTGVGIIGRRKNNVVSDIAAAIQKAGVCIFVFPGLPLKVNSQNPGPYVDTIELRFRIHEHPALNKTSVDAYALVELLLRDLDEKQFTAITGLNPLYWSERPVEYIADDNLVIFDVVALTSGGLTPRAT